ncbi:MAG: 4'-phosphopantetheinyl transferase superfamily protein, partial [Lysobacterales bacterium]
MLSTEEIQRSERFSGEADRTHFLQRRAFRRYCGVIALDSQRPLSKVVFCEAKNGRPFISDLPDLCFSFSSCRQGFLGAWSFSLGVGVDIEDDTRELEVAELSQQYFRGSESSVIETFQGLQRLRVFYQFWCLKEAAL